MSFDHLTVIGERINPGFVSSKELLESHDIAGLQELARKQEQLGAKYLSINVGCEAEKDPSYMIEVIRAVQQAVDLPLSIDSPDVAVQEACIKAYDPALSGGAWPIMNSVAEGRTEMLELRKIQPTKVIFMASERHEDGHLVPNRCAADVLATARRLVSQALEADSSLTPHDCIIDVSIGPMASDTENLTATAVGAIKAIGADPALKGVHQSVGLSNLSIMLPRIRIDDMPLRHALECAFLTETVPAGLDWLLATAGRQYHALDDGHPVLQSFREFINADGFDALMILRDLYAPA